MAEDEEVRRTGSRVSLVDGGLELKLSVNVEGFFGLRHLEVIEKCLDEYDNEEVFLSFNVGKDCTALLHLIHTVLVKRHGPRPYPRLTAVYFRPSNPFKEVENFIHETANRYKVNLITEESEIKEGLGRLMKEPYKKWKACFVGVRRVDPKCTYPSL